MNNDKFFQPVFTAQGLMHHHNNRFLEIEIASSGDGLRHKIVDLDNAETISNPAIFEAEIEHKENEEAGFYIGDTFHNLQNFIKL